jgi:cytochrome oxidase Cu insertion factor (SCO1/SenC/PrrC family)
MKVTLTPRTTLVIIAAMFLLPLVLAWLMYTGVLDFQPESTKNRGVLVSPPIPFDWRLANSLSETGSTPARFGNLSEHWVVLYPLDGACDSECERHLFSLRQVHLASGRHRDRIRLVVLLADQPSKETIDTIGAIYREFIMAADISGKLRRATEKASDSTSPPTSKDGSTYLIDPLGNIMMVYPVTADPNDLKEDLKRLLKWSKLDEQS